ncbi:hypothetical protein N0V90_008522 [Kalmusia sp. IMI 367209]|nr:hypothetical protein N0V90_008522 [Kalmusia sp. IMI 367209]
MDNSTTTSDVGPLEVDVTKYPNAQKLLSRCQDFLNEVENLCACPTLLLPFLTPSSNDLRSTPGHALETHLNTAYGPGTPIYEDFCALTLRGLNEGWIANIEIDGRKYRRSKVALPKPSTRFMSITTVYMSSEEEYSGQYHSHPYGEINCVVQIDKSAELKGMQGWQKAGWTSPGPGTHQ